jgi:superfamily II RNA helicase
MTYMGMANIGNFLAILSRLAQVLEMEEHQPNRLENIHHTKDVSIKIKDAAFKWGYRVKTESNNDDDKKKEGSKKTLIGGIGARGKVQVEEFDDPVIKGINLEMNDSGLLVVVG